MSYNNMWSALAFDHFVDTAMHQPWLGQESLRLVWCCCRSATFSLVRIPAQRMINAPGKCCLSSSKWKKMKQTKFKCDVAWHPLSVGGKRYLVWLVTGYIDSPIKLQGDCGLSHRDKTYQVCEYIGDVTKADSFKRCVGDAAVFLESAERSQVCSQEYTTKDSCNISKYCGWWVFDSAVPLLF